MAAPKRALGRWAYLVGERSVRLMAERGDVDHETAEALKGAAPARPKQAIQVVVSGRRDRAAPPGTASSVSSSPRTPTFLKSGPPGNPARFKPVGVVDTVHADLAWFRGAATRRALREDLDDR
jgi:hypothetical protein